MVKKDGMGFTRIRTPQKNYVRFFRLAVRTRSSSRPKNCRQTGDARRVSSPVATVDVVATDHRADKFLRGVVKFVGGFRTAEHAKGERSVLGYFTAQPFRNAIECLLPRCLTVLSVFPHQRTGQPFA
jgi:hypothetical protein